MKDKKIKKILKIIAIALLLILFFSNISNARVDRPPDLGGGRPSTSDGGASGIDIDTEDLEDIYAKQDSTFNKIGGKIIGVATYLCYAAAVIVLIYKGVQFMQKAPEAKAEAKKELVSYAIGAFILFGIGGILQIIGTIAKNSLF